MVKIQGPQSEYDRLDALVHELVAEHGLHLDLTGWTRKTYDVYDGDGRHPQRKLLVRVESFATTNGEVEVFDEAGMGLAEAIATRLEAEFGVAEAVVVRKSR